MNILLTGDWQTEWANLDLCLQAKAEVLEILKREKLDGVFFLGDLKKHYDPIQTSVIQFWHDFIEELVGLKYFVGILLGNHDRIGQYDDKKNWLSILAKAGAHVYDRPAVLGPDVFILPWNRDVKALKKYLKHFRRYRKDKDCVLLFHADIKNTKYNQLGAKSDAKLSVEDFHSNKYLACIGGHIHLHQKLGKNIYYTGSPFCTDWGEANQRKGYMLVSNGKVRFVESRIPSWYDESWPNFHTPNSAKGIRVRVHCECDSARNYGQVIEQARQRATSKYPGATIFVEPEFTDREVKDAVISATDHDSRKIEAYVNQTLPQSLDKDAKRAVKYLTARLDAVSGKRRSIEGVKFIKAVGKNFLSFKDVECKFNGKGLVVVQGINEDRPGSSNGAGKTSYLQLLPVALFGTTFKGQKHDRWARRGSKREAYVHLAFKDARGRLVEVTRGRRPSQLRLVVDKTDQSVGLRSDAKDATQGSIEQVSGYTWQTLANAVYIDQSVARAFLSGRKSDRSQVLSSFQNLERFAKALVLVKKDSQLNDENYEHVNLSLHDVDARIEEIEEQIQYASKQSNKRLVELTSTTAEAEKEYQNIKAHYEKFSEKQGINIDKLNTKSDRLGERIVKADALYRRAQARLYNLQQKDSELGELSENKTCPTCEQVIRQGQIRNARLELKRLCKIEQKNVGRWLAFANDKTADQNMVEKQIQDLTNEEDVEKSQVEATKRRYEHVRLRKSEASRMEEVQETIRRSQSKLGKLNVQRKILIKSLQAYDTMRKFYEYCKEAFNRDGIPAFLSRNLVPYLNKEAAFYSELFCDKAIQIRFEVVNGEFEVSTVNATGGDNTGDQSSGEQASAGLIASFALRSIAPRCNVLILDEPGAGLDDRSVRKFAQGLLQLRKRFETIFITTHNQALISELGQEKTVTIEKKRGVSSVL